MYLTKTQQCVFFIAHNNRELIVRKITINGYIARFNRELIV